VKTTPKKAGKWPKAVKVGSATAKVYRLAHATSRTGWTYVVSWHSDGRRHRQKFADSDAALKEARLRAEQISAGKVEAAGFSKADRDELLTLRQLSGEIPPVSAMQEWLRARELTAGNIIPAAEAWAARNSKPRTRVKTSEVLKRFLAFKTKAGLTVAEDHKSTWDRIREKFGELFIDTVTTRQIEEWITEPPKPGTQETRRKRIVSLWNWAQKQNYLSRDVANEAEHTATIEGGEMEIELISPQTYAKLLNHFRAHHPEYLPALVLAGFCGMRRGEIHAQVWEDINLQSGHLRVTKGKRGTPARRLVPLCPAAVEWLMLTTDRTELVCGNLAIDRIRKIGRTAEYRLPKNCFRDSFISHRVAQTGNIAETSLEAGNSPQIIRKHYLELVTKPEGEQWFSITPANVGEIINMKEASA